MAENAQTFRLLRLFPFFGKGNAAIASDRVKKSRKLGLVFWLAVSWLSLCLLATISTNFITFPDPLSQDYAALSAPWTMEHLMGTDNLGRNMFSRVIFGAATSFKIAFTSPFIGMGLGLILGMCAGYFRGRVDSTVSIFIDSILAFPNIVLAIAILFYAGANLTNLVLVIAFYTIPQFTRISRANTMLYAQREFVVAARAQGASHIRILFRELLPNVIVPVAAYSLLIMSFTIALEGTLSFLGVGLPPPDPTWGQMISEGVEELEEDAFISFVPAAFMFLTILSLNLMGDRLRQFTDVKASSA
ncbi:MAG: ABC transporter permease [Rhodospirillaceae bacterium]|jgi:peptide/nickel transport system permease protein|nr:ABC transporter permease [Rhodospirillaceae bacterium]MBT4589647.1 ABC transporter permease [Rhodospirillaceae bacterium]MBT4941113.1 ABC transporter permease [Rhodospirillaceae bacterium]MBT7267046.1 ABC transporter permease [Rhodospirillaceae bacterium]